MKVGGPTATRQQLKHLLDMSERDHITLRAVTFDAGAYPGSGQSIHYAHGPVPQLDTVYLDQAHGSRSSTPRHSCTSTARSSTGSTTSH
jgi:hypothetical protein